MPCIPTRFPNGLEVGSCLHLTGGASLPFNEVYLTAADSPYDMTGDEDIIWCTGFIEINLVAVSSAVRLTYINADGDTVMLTPDGSDTTTVTTITDGNTALIGAKKSTSQWRSL